jgi:hypothetical protein
LPEIAVFRGYIAVFGVKNGDIGNQDEMGDVLLLGVGPQQAVDMVTKRA